MEMMMKTMEETKNYAGYPMCKEEMLIAEIRMKVLKTRIAEALRIQKMYIQITSGKLS